jgi:hypothetical protein
VEEEDATILSAVDVLLRKERGVGMSAEETLAVQQASGYGPIFRILIWTHPQPERKSGHGLICSILSWPLSEPEHASGHGPIIREGSGPHYHSERLAGPFSYCYTILRFRILSPVHQSAGVRVAGSGRGDTCTGTLAAIPLPPPSCIPGRCWTARRATLRRCVLPAVPSQASGSSSTLTASLLGLWRRRSCGRGEKDGGEVRYRKGRGRGGFEMPEVAGEPSVEAE